MGSPVISVRGLGKKYRLGETIRHDTLRDKIAHSLKTLFAKKENSEAQSAKRKAHPETNPQSAIPNCPPLCAQPSALRPPELPCAPPSALRPPPSSEFWALKDVSFDVQQGEVLGIIGRNGAGKSTLLKILSQITEPTEGEIHMRGRVASLLEVGTGFHPELTGRENIFLNGAILGMARAEISRKFDEIVAFAEIEMFLDTPVKRYSSGMYVRLAFAVAAHLEPEILIVDEVLAVGDAQFQKKCLGKMGEVARDGRTVLFVSHNLAAVTQLCCRAIWLEAGSVAQDGFPDEVIRNYLSNNTTNNGQHIWRYPGDAPGDSRVRLLGGRFIQDGQVTGIIDINKPASIEMSFVLLQNAQNLIAAVNFFASDGLCLSCSADWSPNSLKKGFYSKKVNIPAHLFSEGRIDVLLQLVFYEPNIPSVVVPSALTVDATDSNHPKSVRGLYKGSWPGLMRIHLDWDQFTPQSSPY